MDAFERLGLPRRFFTDAAELERAYLALSRQVHPDFHQQSGSAGLSASMDASATLNEAYTTLRDPFRRAEHMLTLAGGPTPSEVKEMPMAFLEEMMELRMALEEAKADPAEAERLETAVITRQVKLFDAVGKLLETPMTAKQLIEVRQSLNAVRFLKSVLRDLADSGA